MKVAIVGSRGVPASYGGFETFAQELSRRLAARGFDMTVVCQKTSEKIPVWEKVTLLYSAHKKEFHPLRFYYDSLKIASKQADLVLVCGVGGAIFYPFFSAGRSKL